MQIKYRRMFSLVDNLNRILNVVVKLFVFPLVLIAAFAVYDFLQTELDAVRAGRLAKEYVLEGKNEESTGVDFASLKQKNPEIVAWLRIPDTKIDFPVMHARDNKFYLSHDFEKNFAITGGIFLDYRNSADFSDSFSIIYGHRMSSGRMFSDVGKFKDKAFFDEHPKAIIFTPERNYVLGIVAFASVAGDDGVIYGFDNYTKQESAERIYSKAIHKRGEVSDLDKRYVLLSTCSVESEGVRDVVLGYLE